MYKIRRMMHIHIILIYFTFIYMHRQALVSSEQSTSTSTIVSDDMTDEQVRDIKKEYKALAMERLFDIKGKPSEETTKDPNSKLFVPSAMLKEYISFRDEVREVVPDDRDFYGRINIDAAGSREDIWSAHIGDFEVNMPEPRDESHREEDASHIALVPLAGDPVDVPEKIVKTLAPFTFVNKKSITVLLKYNLSQEIYSSPTAATDFKRAELRLTREKINDCGFDDCTRTYFTSSKKQSSKSSRPEDTRSKSTVPRYQSIYVYKVTGIDQFGDPTVTIHDLRRIDTRRTSPISMDISTIVETWLKDPSTNHGIIVRIFDLGDGITPSHKTTRDTSSDSMNATETEIGPTFESMGALEHVRLKRSFRSTSDSYELWREKQPSIIIWSKVEAPETPRHHVKRHNSEEPMQADEPDATTTEVHASTTTQSSSEEAHTNTQTAHTDKLPHASSIPSHSRRDHMPAANNSTSRRSSQSSRASNSGRASSQQGSRPKGKARPATKHIDKCSKRTLNINFDEVGWSSWIIAPHSYYANYCSGDCNWPLSDTQNSTNHAIIQSIYRSVGRLVPKSCCAPVKLGRMAILYQLDGIVQMRLYDDMIVEACGCL